MNPDNLSIELQKFLREKSGDVALVVHLLRVRLYALALEDKAPEPLTQEYLKSRLNYNPITGLFTWKACRPDRIGKTIYGTQSQIYIKISLKGFAYTAHILAWLYMTGSIPTKYIDHKNGLKKDNRWDNLREASQSQNMANAEFGKKKKSGLPRGVFLRTDGKRKKIYRAMIKVVKRNIMIGSYLTKEEAEKAYNKYASQYFGEFAFYNRSGAP